METLDKQKLLEWLEHMHEGNYFIGNVEECVAYKMVIKKVKGGIFNTYPAN